jgi:nitroimidazol reductase NimA-like FMN-containing flavoprotein (pyridoxamine 5'-phosphate oxidase superfamily)
MFKEMRRDKKRLTEEAALEILASGEEGVLATMGDDGYPYATPLNYAYQEGCLYFHCAPAGHKLDNIRHNPKVSFCVVTDSEIVPAKFSTRFKSVVVFGVAEAVEGAEKEAGLRAMIRKYAADHMAAGEKYIRSAGEKTTVVRIKIAHISGKAAQ